MRSAVRSAIDVVCVDVRCLRWEWALEFPRDVRWTDVVLVERQMVVDIRAQMTFCCLSRLEARDSVMQLCAFCLAAPLRAGNGGRNLCFSARCPCRGDVA